MANETNETNPTTPETTPPAGAANGAMTAEDYVINLNSLRANSVDRAEYDRVMRENRTLANALLNGATAANGNTPTPAPDIDAMRKELFSGKEMTNLEYVQKTLALRDALINAGERDPFLPAGRNYDMTNEDIAEAQRLAEGLQHCVEIADGDAGVFNRELERITVDTAPRRPKRA